MERLRNKRLIFVGDSLNRNQWFSMLCLIEPSLPPSSKSTNKDNFTILQVASNCDDPDHHRLKNRTVRIEAIEKHARLWTDADILIFNSYAWWLDPSITLLWGSFESPHAIYKKVVMRLRPYEIALRTWSEWLEMNINRTKTQLFFMSMSPFHAFSEEWGVSKGQNCYGETEPILKEQEQWGTLINRDMMQTAEAAIDGLERKGVKVHYLNITHMSAYRKEAHPSIYRKYLVAPSKEQLANPMSYSDCLHWCLPGLPDVWNQILYAFLFLK